MKIPVFSNHAGTWCDSPQCMRPGFHQPMRQCVPGSSVFANAVLQTMVKRTANTMCSFKACTWDSMSSDAAAER